jgi:hypothetical protein
MAGSVEAAGKKVTKFQPGEEVFGGLNERGLSPSTSAPAKTQRCLNASQPDVRAGSVRTCGGSQTSCRRCPAKAGASPGTRCWSTTRPGRPGTFAVQIARALGAERNGNERRQHRERGHVLRSAPTRSPATRGEDFTRARRRRARRPGRQDVLPPRIRPVLPSADGKKVNLPDADRDGSQRSGEGRPRSRAIRRAHGADG